jgi:hypothetical protein
MYLILIDIYSYGHANDVDEAIYFVANEVAQSNGEIVFEHYVLTFAIRCAYALLRCFEIEKIVMISEVITKSLFWYVNEFRPD